LSAVWEKIRKPQGVKFFDSHCMCSMSCSSIKHRFICCNKQTNK